MNDERDLDPEKVKPTVELLKIEGDAMKEILRVLLGRESHQIQIRGLPQDPFDLGVIVADLIGNFARAYETAGLADVDMVTARIAQGLDQALDDPEERDMGFVWRKENNS